MKEQDLSVFKNKKIKIGYLKKVDEIEEVRKIDNILLVYTKSGIIINKELVEIIES